MFTEKYRRIALELPSPINKRTDAAIAALNQCFHSDDFYVTRNDNEMEVWLRQVNLEELVVAVNKIADNDGKRVMLRVYHAVESIRGYGVKGNKRLYVGYNEERKVIGRKEKEIRRRKHFYANDYDYRRENCRLPTDFSNRIICGNSAETLKKLPDNCVDLVFTSPPYNFGLDYEENSDAADWESYFGQLFTVFDECVRVLTYGGRIIVNAQPLFSDYIPSHHIISNYFMRKRLIWKGEILWEKNNYNCKYTAWGSWKSPSNPYLKYTWEFLEVFCKGDLKKRGEPANVDIRADQFKEWVVAKWSIAPERRMKDYGHPAMFPEELAKRAILLFSFRDDVVLDPFNGVGTTTAVAQRNGRRFLGIDIVPEYCATAKDRLTDALFPLLL